MKENKVKRELTRRNRSALGHFKSQLLEVRTVVATVGKCVVYRLDFVDFFLQFFHLFFVRFDLLVLYNKQLLKIDRFFEFFFGIVFCWFEFILCLLAILTISSMLTNNTTPYQLPLSHPANTMPQPEGWPWTLLAAERTSTPDSDRCEHLVDFLVYPSFILLSVEATAVCGIRALNCILKFVNQ